ncbi:MAG: immunoglobulin-like domain-containing protein [Clostridium sp.]
MGNIVAKKVIAGVIAGLMIFSSGTVIGNAASLNSPSVTSADFGIGKGIKWPSQVNAPYVDMVDYYTAAGVGINGAPKLKKFYDDTGVKFFNVGFIQSLGSVSNGKVDWGWGGYRVLSEKAPDDSQYKGIKQSMKEIRDIGGDVAISFGGLNGVALWQTSQDVDVLANTYIEIIQGYGATRIDLDVEGGAQNKALNVTNAKAIKKAQLATGVEVVLTVPVLPDGLTHEGLGVLEAYLANGVDLVCINIMTMCYGSGVLLPGENYGTASLRAVDSLKDQLKTYYTKFAGKTLTNEEAYAKIGTTVSVGFEGSAHPIFTKEWSKLVVDHAIQNKIGMSSFWSINRDSTIQKNQGIYAPYEHTKEFKRFGSLTPGPGPGGNNAPNITGVESKTIKLGDYYNPLYLAKAKDVEDGDLSSKIVVSGSVNTKVVGAYDITYKVADSKGLETAKKITITVKEVVDPTGEAYSSTKIYLAGNKVVYNGILYEAQWWTTGEKPGEASVWKKIGGGENIGGGATAQDLEKVAAKYNSKKGDTLFDEVYDYNVDNIIDIFDIVIIGKRM